MHEIRISFYLTKFASHFFIVLIGILYLDSISAMDDQLKMRINQIVDSKLSMAGTPVVSTRLGGGGGSYANRSDNARREMYNGNYGSEDDRYSNNRYSQDRYLQDRGSDDYEDRRSNRGYLNRNRQNREENDYSDDRNSDSFLQYDESGNLMESSSRSQKSNTDSRRSNYRDRNYNDRNYSDRSYRDRNYGNSSDRYSHSNRGGENRNWGYQQKNTRRKPTKSRKKRNSTARKGMIKLYTVKRSISKSKLFRSARSNALMYGASAYGGSFGDLFGGYKIKSYAGVSSENTSILSTELNSPNIQDTLNMLKRNQANPLETIEYKEVNARKECGSDPNARYLTKSGKYTTKNKYFAHKSCS